MLVTKNVIGKIYDRFERAVLEIAARAAEENALMAYQDDSRPLALTARPVSRCAAVVRVFEGGVLGRGELLAEKMVNGCFPESAPTPP